MKQLFITILFTLLLGNNFVSAELTHDQVVSDPSYQRIRRFLFVPTVQTPYSLYLRVPKTNFYNYVYPSMSQQGWGTSPYHFNDVDNQVSHLVLLNYNTFTYVQQFGHLPTNLPTEMLTLQFGTDNDSMLNRLKEVSYLINFYYDYNNKSAYAFFDALKNEIISTYGKPGQAEEYQPRLAGDGSETIKYFSWTNNGVIRVISLTVESHKMHYEGSEIDEVAQDEITYQVGTMVLPFEY